MFANAYFKEVYESEHVRTSTKRLCVILDDKYENSDLHKVSKNQCQHLTMTQRNELPELLQKFEDYFDGKIETWKIDPIDFELKEDVNPICLRPYPVPKVHDEIFKKEIGRLVLPEVLEVESYSEWGALSFTQPKAK